MACDRTLTKEKNVCFKIRATGDMHEHDYARCLASWTRRTSTAAHRGLAKDEVVPYRISPDRGHTGGHVDAHRRWPKETAASALASHRRTANSPPAIREIAGKHSWHWKAQKEGADLREMHKVVEGSGMEVLVGTWNGRTESRSMSCSPTSLEKQKRDWDTGERLWFQGR
jgi:hypothetical protein